MPWAVTTRKRAARGGRNLGMGQGRAPAVRALPAPWTTPPNPSTTTRGFRMLGVHACELLRTQCCGQRGNPLSARSGSTEFLYPSPICDHLLLFVLRESKDEIRRK